MAKQRMLLRLGEFFEATYEPHFLPQARAGTIDVYHEALARWRELSGDPTMEAIDNLTLASFRAKLARREWRGKVISPATVNKCLRTINALLAKAGPAGPRNRDALGLIRSCPWAKQLKVLRKKPRPVPQDILGKLYAACSIAVAPAIAGVRPTAWWRGLIVTASQVAPRRGALFDLLWEDVDLARGVLRVVAENDKEGAERWKPLKEVVVRHLVAIRSAEAKVFPWAYESWRMFYREWHRIQTSAGIPRAQHYKFHALKASCGTQLAGVAGSHAVRAMLDHSSIVTSEHYVDSTEWLREAVERMPHPVEFDGAFGDRDRDRVRG